MEIAKWLRGFLKHERQRTKSSFLARGDVQGDKLVRYVSKMRVWI